MVPIQQVPTGAQNGSCAYAAREVTLRKALGIAQAVAEGAGQEGEGDPGQGPGLARKAHKQPACQKQGAWKASGSVLSGGGGIPYPLQTAGQEGEGDPGQGPGRLGLAAWQLRSLAEASACRMTARGVWVLRRRWWRDLKAIPAEYGAIREACERFGIPIEWEP